MLLEVFFLFWLVTFSSFTSSASDQHRPAKKRAMSSQEDENNLPFKVRLIVEDEVIEKNLEQLRQEKEALLRNIRILEQQKQNLTESNDALQADYESLAEKVSNLETEKQTLTVSNDILRKMVSDLTVGMDELKSGNLYLQQSYMDLYNQGSLLVKDKDTFIEMQNGNINEMIIRGNELTKQFEVLKNRLAVQGMESTRKEPDSARSFLGKRNGENRISKRRSTYRSAPDCRHLTVLLEEKNRMYSALEKECHGLKVTCGQIHDNSQNLSIHMSRLESANAILGQNVSSLIQTLLEEKGKNGDLEHQLQSSLSQIQSLGTALANIEQDLDAQRNAYGDLDNRYREKVAELSKLVISYDTLNQSYSEKVKSLNDNFDDLSARSNQMSKELQETKQLLEKAQVDYIELKDNFEIGHKALHQKNLEVISLQVSLATLNSTLNAELEEIKQRDAIKESQSSAVNDSFANLNGTRNELEERKQTDSTKESETSALNDSLATLNSSFNTLAELEEIKRAYDFETRTLNERLSELNRTLAQCESEKDANVLLAIAKLSEIKALNNDLGVAEGTISGLMEEIQSTHNKTSSPDTAESLHQKDVIIISLAVFLGLPTVVFLGFIGFKFIALFRKK